ncbi:DUF1758 domain-containing protein [Trichonephila clavipes]|nr:DUF1758 domain-containing protein [Trichonephila clavipes]
MGSKGGLSHIQRLIVTKAKIFIQELWKIKLDWSEQLPPDAMEEWMNLPKISEKRAYAAVVYIKCFNESGQSQTRLLCSKSRVAPLKTLTIPRVAEIQALSKDYHWKHVSSKNNPADLISRGCNVDELLKNEMWFSGPDLQTDEYEDNQLFPDPSYRDELKCAVTLSMTEFINNIKAKESCNKEKYLTADEVKRSTEFLAKIAQLSEFKAEIDALKKAEKQVAVRENNVAVGCLVLLKENDLPPANGQWQESWRLFMELTSVTMTGHICRYVILEQHVRLFGGAMGAEFLFMDDNARPHRANIVDECLQSEDITRMDWPAYSPDSTNCSPSISSHLYTGTSEGIA